jgi:hypothetical protein
MPAPLRIHLTEEEDRTLRELSYARSVPQRVKQRATALRLNAVGWKVDQIAAHLDWAPQTVRETIHRWQVGGLGGLWGSTGSRQASTLEPRGLASVGAMGPGTPSL